MQCQQSLYHYIADDIIKDFQNEIIAFWCIDKLNNWVKIPVIVFSPTYNSKKIVGRADFSDQFKKIIIRYKRIGYNINIMQQSDGHLLAYFI